MKKTLEETTEEMKIRFEYYHKFMWDALPWAALAVVGALTLVWINAAYYPHCLPLAICK